MPHLGGGQGVGLVLQRLSTTYQGLLELLQQAAQHCWILLPKESHDVVLACGGDLVDFAVAVLKAAGLGLEGFEFCDAEAPKAGYASAREPVFLECVVEETRHVVPANEGAIDPHKVNIRDVVHELEELDLTMGKTFHKSVNLDMVGVGVSVGVSRDPNLDGTASSATLTPPPILPPPSTHPHPPHLPTPSHKPERAKLFL